MGENKVTETKRCDLWRFGSLHHNGTTYAYEANGNHGVSQIEEAEP